MCGWYLAKHFLSLLLGEVFVEFDVVGVDSKDLKCVDLYPLSRAFKLLVLDIKVILQIRVRDFGCHISDSSCSRL